jgi:sugar phosphate isomerase/epimerase
MPPHHVDSVDRRRFLIGLAGLGSLVAMPSAAQGRASQLGLQLYTVRDRLATDFEGTLGAVAAAGYTEVELFGSLGERTPQQVRTALDRAGLSAPSTHIAVVPGPDVERQLVAARVIGHRYAMVRTATGAGDARGSVDGWKRIAHTLNETGAAGKAYGVRALFHNHVDEFAPLAGTSGTGYDILLAETDPALVAMELDIGWARIAGQDPLAMFRRHPGRYPLWHVKDVRGLADAVSHPIGERQKAAAFAPLGAGEIDYRPVFEAATTAGLEHFFVEQDNAPAGDSLGAIGTSAANLKRLLGRR